ncbi:MAG: cytochrome P450 [Pseudonocardiales bacterium]|nr:cytochrome P450 [Pseudonocardiales bacterium]
MKTRPVDDLSDEVRLLVKSLISTDPPDHTRLRGLVRKAFSPRLVERLRPRIQQIADELLDAVLPAGRMDLIDDYASPLPNNGVTIPQGDQVVIVLASANRDETRFARADQLDVTRTSNHHLGFGKGVHFCLGASLARIEGQIAISRLIRRMPDLHPAIPLDKLRWRPSIIMRGLRSFPVLFTAH